MSAQVTPTTANRLDMELLARGWFRSREKARQAVRAGMVSVDGEVVVKPAAKVVPNARIVLAERDHYVSRAAHKLKGALTESGTVMVGRVLDAGASTGGFTQVALECGAECVYAVDVGHGQFAPELRDDPRVVLLEGLNLRDLSLEHVGSDPVDLVVADVSFISLKLLLQPLLAVLRPSGQALLLVKPQFEVGRAALDSKGVVRDPALREQAVAEVVQAAAALGWPAVWTAESGLPGEHGNVEYFVKLSQAR